MVTLDSYCKNLVKAKLQMSSSAELMMQTEDEDAQDSAAANLAGVLGKLAADNNNNLTALLPC